MHAHCMRYKAKNSNTMVIYVLIKNSWPKCGHTVMAYLLLIGDNIEP